MSYILLHTQSPGFNLGFWLPNNQNIANLGTNPPENISFRPKIKKRLYNNLNMQHNQDKFSSHKKISLEVPEKT